MTFAGIIEGKETVTVDGYSNFKTKKAAIRDLGRFIRDNVNKAEGQSIIDYPVEERISMECKEQGCYFLEVEEAPCVCQYNEETDEMEYKEGRWYLCCRIVK